ncbi:hypothetical protein BGX24_002756 [Mortierella sp. AD032]|nr:hypothetical protein BGX24_002756 [Mortierella sp. AD032]
MKLSIPILVVALAAKAQAIKFIYSANTLQVGSQEKRFSALLSVEDGVKLWADYEGGSSPWVQYGIHKIQLNNAQMRGFNYCINVYGNVDCNWIETEEPKCNFRPDIQQNQCFSGYKNDNWGY